MKPTLFLLALWLLLNPLQATEGRFDFEPPTPAQKGQLPPGWQMNTAHGFQPLGNIAVLPVTYGKHTQALRLQAGKRPINVYTTKAIPARLGDAFAINVLFRSPDGKSTARIGTYDEYHAAEYTPINRDWDMRQTIVEITKPKTKTIRFFIAAKPHQTVDYVFLNWRKLNPDETGQYTPGKTRKLWQERTRGINLARGKKVTFNPKPNYQLTARGNSDETDLTDGKFGRIQDTLWFDQEAVAFYRALHGATMMIDLGSVQPVGHTVIRINGGRPSEGWGTSFPKILEAWVSKDGINFHLAHALKKVAITESNIADWKDLYYLPESDNESVPHYVYPFQLNLNADARYVALRAPIYTSLMMICDEWAIIKADPKDRQGQSWNKPYDKQPQPLFHQTVILRPRMDTFYLDKTLKLPNWLTLDSRLPDDKVKFHFTINLPQQVAFNNETSWPAFTRHLTDTQRQGNRVTYTFTPTLPYPRLLPIIRSYGMPFFFSLDGRTIPKGENHVTFTTFVNGQRAHEVRLPIAVIDIPKVPPLKRLNISLAWTENRHFATYPNYLETQRLLGFNTLPVFPLSKDAPKVRERILQAKQQGYVIRQQMSPAAILRSRFRDDPDIACVGSSDKGSVCPSYRGKHYHEMLQWIRDGIRDFPADYITFDEEKWGVPALNEAMKCSRCNALRQRMGMDWKTFLNWVQADFLKPYKDMVQQGARLAGRKTPVVGFYATVPPALPTFGNIKRTKAGPIDFLGFSNMWPKHMDEIQDSYYGRNTRIAHQRARAIYLLMPTPAKICPWITGGSGAHTETAYSNRTGQHLIETLMNGAGGIQYFMYPSFESPLDYYYHARTMKLLQPYEDILMDGTLDPDYHGSDTSLLYTKRTLGNTSIILIGNYERQSPMTTTLPVENCRQATNLTENKTIVPQKNSLTVTVPADDFLLLELKHHTQKP